MEISVMVIIDFQLPVSTLNHQSQFPHDTHHEASAQISGIAALSGGPARLCQLVRFGIAFCDPPGADLFEYSGYQAHADWSGGIGGEPLPSLPHAHPESSVPGVRMPGIRRRSGQSHPSQDAQVSWPKLQSSGGCRDFIAGGLPLHALPDILSKAAPNRATASSPAGIFSYRPGTPSFSDAFNSEAGTGDLRHWTFCEPFQSFPRC